MATKKKNKKSTKKSAKKKTSQKNTSVDPRIEKQIEFLKGMGVEVDNPSKPPEKPAEPEGKGQLKRTEDPNTKTKADEMWDSIKDRPIEVFALSNKTVSDYVTRVPVVDNLLHLKLSAQAVWPPLENIINQYLSVSQFQEPVIEFVAGYLVVGTKLKQ